MLQINAEKQEEYNRLINKLNSIKDEINQRKADGGNTNKFMQKGVHEESSESNSGEGEGTSSEDSDTEEIKSKQI